MSMIASEQVEALDIAAKADFKLKLRELNQGLATTGEKVEGSVCYADQMPSAQLVNAVPVQHPHFVHKRINIAEVAKRSNVMLEIGLNGGHSALILLLSNPLLTLYCVDIFRHQYTFKAADYLRRTFGSRFHFYQGDSREVLPRFAIDRPKLRFDAIHVDGGHAEGVCFADMSNSLRLAETGAFVILDDLQAPVIHKVFNLFIEKGFLYRDRHDTFLFRTPLHEVVRAA